MIERPRVLLIEDDTATAQMLADFLELEGFETTVTGSASGAADLLGRRRPAAIVLDVARPSPSSAGLLGKLMAEPGTGMAAVVPVVVVTAAGAASTATGAAAVLDRPVDLEQLRA